MSMDWKNQYFQRSIIIKTFFSPKYTIKKMESQAIDWKEILDTYIEQRIPYRIYQELNNKKTNNKNRGQDLNTHHKHR